MSRERMLQALGHIPYTLIDPASEWDDIGFTERPIWVNSQGYGYIMADEPCSSCEVEGIPIERWKTIHSKLAEGSLQLEDIKETSLVELLDAITYGYFDEDIDDIGEILEGLLLLPDEQIDKIYGLETFDGWEFFGTEEDFSKAYVRDWCDYSWDELSDDMLIEWIERLTENNIIQTKYILECSDKDLYIDFQSYTDSLDDYYLGCLADQTEIDTYSDEVSEQLKEYLTNEEADAFYERLWALYPVGEANGDISYSEVYDTFVSKTQDNIRQKYENAYVRLLGYCAPGEIKTFCNIALSDILLDLLDQEMEGTEFDAKVGQYIETSLIKFVDSSSWHLGYQYQDKSYVEVRNKEDLNSVLDTSCPLMWFGPDNTAPIDKWLISCQNDDGFALDHYDLLYHLIDDCNESFDIWYLAECCYWLPDMESILSKSPIQISKNDTVEQFNINIRKYFDKLKDF